MSFDANVLRAMLRLARRREAATEEHIALRVAGEPAAVRLALRRLSAKGWIELRPGASRLTLQGFAVAVALLPGRVGVRPSWLAAEASRKSTAA